MKQAGRDQRVKGRLKYDGCHQQARIAGLFMHKAVKTGAGVIPFALKNGTACFLFHKTFSGRRAGLMVDFGGGSLAGESQVQTAAREFVEETEAMFFAGDKHGDPDSASHSQYLIMLQLIEQALQRSPDRFCSRTSEHGNKPRDWKTFFVEVAYRELESMNTAWAQDTRGRFKKRRELLWLPAQQLLDIIDNRPECLWKRIRQYQGMRELVQVIAGG